MKRIIFLFFFCGTALSAKSSSLMGSPPIFEPLHLLPVDPGFTNPAQDSTSVRISKAAGNVYFLDCVNGFGGGNVAASIGDDGVLLVDDMFASTSSRLASSLKTISDKPVRVILNTHYHSDHIEGNKNFRGSSLIFGHENLSKRIIKTNSKTRPTLALLPMITFTDSLILNFNGEKIRMLHFSNSHTDGDAIVYFTKSKVLHLGDLFFFEMFPAVYAEDGGNIRQMVLSLEKILSEMPSDALVVPGHGNLATMQDLKNYVVMLNETIQIVGTKIEGGKTLDQLKSDKVLAKYDTLGKGGGQTTEQYLSMLYQLLLKEK
jgi:cyclase